MAHRPMYIKFDHTRSRSAVQETLKIPGNIVLFSLHTYVLQQYAE